MQTSLQRGLYAITDSPRQARAGLADQVARAIAGGAVAIQYREKDLPQHARVIEARALLTVCQLHEVPLIINDDAGLAAEIGAAGVHLGQDDTTPSQARRLLGESAIIGVSCYNELERALRAAGEGASYVAFGRFFPSGSKPQAVQASPDLLVQARQRLDLPIVAIGGITPDNGRQLIEAGADLLAVIQGVFGQPDISAAAQRFAALFDSGAEA